MFDILFQVEVTDPPTARLCSLYKTKTTCLHLKLLDVIMHVLSTPTVATDQPLVLVMICTSQITLISIINRTQNLVTHTNYLQATFIKMKKRIIF